MPKIRIDITKYGEEGAPTKTMVIAPEDPNLTWHAFVEQAVIKLGLVYNPNYYALTVDANGTPTYLTSLEVRCRECARCLLGVDVMLIDHDDDDHQQQQ